MRTEENYAEIRYLQYIINSMIDFLIFNCLTKNKIFSFVSSMNISIYFKLKQISIFSVSYYFVNILMYNLYNQKLYLLKLRKK